jgi:hypothetical protein
MARRFQVANKGVSRLYATEQRPSFALDSQAEIGSDGISQFHHLGRVQTAAALAQLAPCKSSPSTLS